MRQIFIFTAGDKNARKHLADSILKPVPFEWMKDALGPEQTHYYQSLLPGQNGFHAWGAVPGPVNKRTWEAMHPGDLVLTVFDNQYHFLSTVVGKFNDPELANRIWGADDEGATWENMYVLTPPKSIAKGVLDETLLKYLSKGYRGYTRISDEKVRNILKDYGSLNSFTQAVFGQALPATPAEQEIAKAKSEADSAPPFAPKDLVDGRQKVLREVVRRQGQPKFRKQLLEAYENRCAVTGCEVEAVLEAAHIAPYLGKESNTVQNGLLLRADIHTLFDLGQLKITTAGEIELDEKLLGTVYGELHGQQIREPTIKAAAPSVAALELKFGLA